MRRSDFIMKLISVLFLAAIVCYVGFRALDLLVDPLRTAPVVACTVEESGAAAGYAVRSETVLSAEGIVSARLRDGEHVAYGQAVATSYAGEASLRIADQIRALELEIGTLTEQAAGRGSDPYASMLALSNAVRHHELDGLDGLALDVSADVFGAYSSDPAAELAALQEQLAELRAWSSSGEGIRVFSSGTFSSVTDGFEGVSPEMLSGLSPTGLESLFDKPEELPDGAFGKLILGRAWYFAALMDASDAARLTVGETASVLFSRTYSEELGMTVESVGEPEDGRCLVVFSSERDLAETSGLRSLTAEVVFLRHTGVLVPKEAVHYGDGGEDGDGAYLYILAGYQAEQVDIELLCEYSGDYYLAQSTEAGALKPGAEVITQASDLYDGKVVR